MILESTHLRWAGVMGAVVQRSSRADAPTDQWVVGIPLTSTPKWVSGCHCNFLRNSKEVTCHSLLLFLGAKSMLWWGCQFVTEQSWPETMKPRKWHLHSGCHTFAQKPQISYIFLLKLSSFSPRTSNNYMVSYSNRHRMILYLVLFIKFKQVHKVLPKYILK